MPLGAASIGQVHKARLKSNGKEVVVKIKYADSEPLFSQDMQTTKQVLSKKPGQIIISLTRLIYSLSVLQIGAARVFTRAK